MLNDRKTKILEAIINDYIATAEPIGSRTIAKKYDLGISSATIRNEMSDLEELGFIIQPHASAGRVPSDKGYRMYVDNLMREKELSQEHTKYLRDIVTNNINHIDYLMEHTAKALSLLTNYTTIVSEPKTKYTIVKHIQLIPLDENTIISVIVTDTKLVKNHAIHMAQVPDMGALHALSGILTKYLQNRLPGQIDAKLMQDIENELGEHKALLAPIIDAVLETIIVERDVQVYTSGAKNILAFPEFSDVDKAKAIFEALEQKQMLISLLGDALELGGTPLQILIGTENTVQEMKNCSIIKTTYRYGKDSYGTIGIIGPTRMNYVEVVAVLNGIVNHISNVIKKLSGG